MIQVITTSIRFLFLAAIIVVAGAANVRAQEGSVQSARDTSERKIVKPYTNKERRKIYSTAMPYGIKYTKKHPLVIAVDWSMPPFSYINNYGEPDGLFIDLLREVFSQFHIAYEIKMMDHDEMYNQIETGKAGLIIDIDNLTDLAGVKTGNAMVANYEVAVLRLETTPRLHSIILIDPKDTLAVGNGTYGLQYLERDLANKSKSLQFKTLSSNDALARLLDGRIKYFLWEESALRRLVKKYGVENDTKIETIDIDGGEFRFFSKDTVLLHELDLVLQQMKTTGQMERTYDKWLEGNKNREEFSLGQTLLLIIIILFIAFTIFKMLRAAFSSDLKNEFMEIIMMSQKLMNSQIIIVNKRRNKVYCLGSKFMSKRGGTIDDFLKLVHPDDYMNVKEVIDMVKEDPEGRCSINFRMHSYDAPEGEWRDILAVSKSNVQDGQNAYIFFVLIDETEVLREKRKQEWMRLKYHGLINMPCVGVAYYNADGTIKRCNETFSAFFAKGGIGKGAIFVDRRKLGDLCAMFNGIVFQTDMDIWLCSMINIPELNIKSAAEIRIRTVWDDEGKCDGYILTIIDREDLRQAKHDLADADYDLVEVKRSLEAARDELYFIMHRNKIRTFRWNVGDEYLQISQESLYDARIAFADLVALAPDEEKERFKRVLYDPENNVKQPYEEVKEMFSFSAPNEKRWYSFHLRPDYDDYGNYKGVFGIRCDVTDFMETQNKLRLETEKSSDSVKQKALFLASMTHELRTPLNAINGFAEILSFMETDEEKKQYVDIMAHNCVMILSLIENILQISTIDTEGMKMRKEVVDFPKIFREKARDLQKYVIEPAVDYKIEVPVQSLMLEIDSGRVMQVLDIFVNNASKFTKNGYIHVGFTYEDERLTIYCRDTGCGIPADKHEEIFERFVKLDEFAQGTGLGLSLAMEIAKGMGGTITLDSKENEGTTIAFNLNISTNYPPRSQAQSHQ